MINIKEIQTGYSSLEIDKVVERGNKLIFYYKERWNKNYKTLSMLIEGEYVIADYKGYNPVYIKCKKEDLVNEINKLNSGFSRLVCQYEYLKNKVAQEKKDIKDKARKEELLKTVKIGDVVERYGKTPNLRLSKILVQEISDYGVSGFYLFNNGSRSGEYTCVSWKYIKKKV